MKEYKLKQATISKIEDEWSHSYFSEELGNVPGVTTILEQGMPTEEFLKIWWQNTETSIIQNKLDKALKHGSLVHQLLEQLNMGLEIELASHGKAVCEAVEAYTQFVREWRPQEIEPEQVVFYQDQKRYWAGTVDLVFKINDKRILVDFKTSKVVSKNHYLQVIAYKEAYEQSYGRKIDHVFILQLGTKHKKLGKPEFEGLPLQGLRWQLHEAKASIKDFERAYDTFLFMNDGEVPQPPKVKVYPETFQLFEGDKINDSDTGDSF